MIEKVVFQGKDYALIIRNQYHEDGVNFITPNDYSQQLAYMHHKKGKLIAPHLHNPVPREVTLTQEVLFIKKGKLRVDFYNDQKIYLESRLLQGGDVILLAEGGHGFEVIEDIEMFEVKQGPYAGEEDKTRFQSVDYSEIQVK